MKNLLRLGRVEGLSFLFLMFVAMPLKYGMDMPIFVRVGGMLHGLLFLAFGAAIVWQRKAQKWDTAMTMWALVSSSIPLGFVFFEQSLKTLERGAGAGESGRRDAVG